MNKYMSQRFGKFSSQLFAFNNFKGKEVMLQKCWNEFMTSKFKIKFNPKELKVFLCKHYKCSILYRNSGGNLWFGGLKLSCINNKTPPFKGLNAIF